MQVFHLPQFVTAVIFDIDNTLYSNDRYIRTQQELLIQRFADRRGIGFSEAAQLIHVRKKQYAAEHDGAQTSIGNIMAALGVSIRENAVWRDDLFKPEKYLEPDERTILAIKELSSCMPIAAVTNNTMGIGRRTLSVLGLDTLFPIIVGLDSCFISKPAREPFEAALRELKMLPEYSVSVGDRYEVDLEVPLSMGMGGILVEELSDLYELPQLLCERQKM